MPQICINLHLRNRFLEYVYQSNVQNISCTLGTAVSLCYNTRRTLQSVVSVVAKYWKMQEQELLQSVMVLLRSATEHARLSFITLCIKKEQMLCIN